MTPSGQGRTGRTVTDGMSAGSSETVLKESLRDGDRKPGEIDRGSLMSFHYT
jgi:hypothetical protein